MRFHRLDLNLLIVLESLLRDRSVSQTASDLKLTQPAISNALSRLRLHFEDELFVQVGRKMVPTPFAESLGEPVVDALEDLKRIVTARSGFDPGSVERTFTFVCSDYVFNVFLTRAIRKLAVVAPGIRIVALLAGEPTRGLLSEGRADFMVAPAGRQDPHHPSAPLFEDRFACIAWTHNPLVGEAITLDDYVRFEHVSVTLGPTNPIHIEQEALEAQGVQRRVAVYAPTFSAVAEAVVGTHFIATVHARAARLFAERLPIKVFEAPVDIGWFTESLQWHKNKGADAGAVWMRDFLIACATEEAAER